MIGLPKRILRKIDEEAKASGIPRSDIVARIVYEYYKENLGPALSHFNVYEDHVTIKDEDLERYVDVQVKGGRLYCTYDETESCGHVDYAWQIDRVQDMIRRGDIKKRGS